MERFVTEGEDYKDKKEGERSEDITSRGLINTRMELFTRYNERNEDLQEWMEDMRKDIEELRETTRGREIIAQLKGTRIEGDVDSSDRDRQNSKWLRAIKKTPSKRR